MALWGLVMTARGVTGLPGGADGIGTYVDVVLGLVMLVCVAVGIARGESLNSDSTLVRVGLVGGVLLYTTALIASFFV